MKYTIPVLALAAACALAGSVSAQSKPTDVYVSVTDAKGNAVNGLTAESFRVKEDGTTREVLKAAPASEPLTVALVLDDSQAIQPAIQMVREAAQAFVKALEGKAEVAVVTFGDRPTIVADYTTDQKKLQDAVGRLFPRSAAGGDLLDTLVDVSKGIQKRKPARPVIAVLMMDNAVEFGTRSYDNVLGEIQASGAALHVISLGTPNTNTTDELRNRNQVVALGTERTGGRRDNILALTAATSAMKQLAAELLGQYVVTYGRPETLIPPEKIAVTVDKPGLTARARTRTGLAGSR
jgi:Ca-activated chloride channel family protein